MIEGVEVSGEGAVAVCVYGEFSLGAHHFVEAIGPVHELVACFRSSGEGYRQVEFHGAGAAYSTPVFGFLLSNHFGGNSIAQTVVVGGEGGVAVNSEIAVNVRT